MNLRPLSIFMCIVFLGLVMTINAQEDVEPGCSVENSRTAIVALANTLLEFESQIESEDDILTLMLGLETQIDNIRVACGFVDINSDNYPNGIVGPFAFGGTLYEVELVSEDGAGTLSSTTIFGDCGFVDPFMITEFAGGSETDLWTFGGDCSLIMEINSPGYWELNINRLR